MTFSFDETYINRWPFEMPNARRDAAVIVSCLWSLFLWNLPVKPTSGAEPRAPTGIEEKPITRENRYHWSFQPLHRPNIPTVRDIDWPITPVDHFILTRLEQAELTPLPAADRVTLIRRVAFDLTGLPPSPDEVDRFLADTSAHAYEKLVDRLLSSPHYGERWAQHWLDLARFAETDGFEQDRVRAEAWRYRDWVIDALNRDLPYDRFVQLQLAGDELHPGDKQAVIATSFCLSGPDMPDINSQDERKHNLLNEITATVGSALLGLQIGCAQCHDHKYDPISQADFYRLRAVFEPAIQLQKGKSISVLCESTGRPTTSYLMLRGNWQRRGPAVSPAFPRIANPWNVSFEDSKAHDKTTGRRTALARWLTRDDHMLTTRVIVNRLWQYHFGHGLSRSPSDFGAMGDEPTHPELLDWLATELVRQNWRLKNIHRLIVTSATYRQASRRTTPGWTTDDHMAAEERLQKSKQVDPQNHLLARFPRRRLEGEAIRDSMLAAAGVISTHRGGSGVRPPLPTELLGTLLENQWNVTPNKAEHDRRSIYIFARRNLRYPIFDAFDRPDANASCPRRSYSTTAPQSLLLLNSEFSLATARRLAGYILAHTGSDRDTQITMAFRRTWGRKPTPTELGSSREFLDQQQELLQSEGRPREQLALPIPIQSNAEPHAAAVLTDLCLALFNSNEFIYVD